MKQKFKMGVKVRIKKSLWEDAKYKYYIKVNYKVLRFDENGGTGEGIYTVQGVNDGIQRRFYGQHLELSEPKQNHPLTSIFK